MKTIREAYLVLTLQEIINCTVIVLEPVIRLLHN